METRYNSSSGTTEVLNDEIPKNKFHIKVYAPFKTYYEGIVSSVSAVNGTGPFDILANHHNFITLLNPCDLTIRPEEKTEKPEIIKISRGIMQVKANNVIVFLDV